ncbi:hypothetical protein ACFQRB_16705 [Halobaculum litoreum]|uniref:Uncharacterized protein n=2 Tax=Halobaculum litoreum TaxID=3031998 RepID=A0ABD5XRF3_9EURY
MSTTAQKLIYVGLGMRKSGQEPKFEGPLGMVSRPFAGVNFAGETVSFGTRVSTEVGEELTEVFETKKHPAAREALRVGVIYLQIEELDITGPAQIKRPFAKLEMEDPIDDPRAMDALQELRSVL